MSGHSKWSKVKHQKATTDVVKAAAFTKASHAISVAVREGGGITNPDMNFRLRLAIEKAREVNMPKENIERSIAKGAGVGGQAIESVMYEGYGPGGVAFIVEAATDNRQRTASGIKNVFDRAGGSLAGPGAVAYQFSRSGVLVVDKSPDRTFDMLLEQSIAAGADDVVEQEDVFEIYTQPGNLMAVKKQLEQATIPIANAEFIMRPTTTVEVTPQTHDTVLQMEEKFSELPDVQRVYTNEKN